MTIYTYLLHTCRRSFTPCCGDPHKLVGIAFYLSGITPDSKEIPVATKNSRTKATEFAWLHLTIKPIDRGVPGWGLWDYFILVEV
jgi:hypothetical protein